MRKLLYLILILLTSCFPIQETRYLQNQSHVRHIENSVVALVEAKGFSVAQDAITDTNGIEHQSYCAGFFINHNTILTAFHCVNRENKIEMNWLEYKVITYNMFLNDPYMKNYKIFLLKDYDQGADIAILQLKPTEENNFLRQSMCISYNQGFIGNTVSVIGHPRGVQFVFSEGILSRNQFISGNNRMFLANAPIYPGNSGGALINNSGCVIGVTSAFFDDRSHLGIFSSLINIREKLENYDHGIGD